MSSNVVVDKQRPTPAVADKQPKAVARGRPRDSGPGGADLPREASREAQRVAAMVLEVLAGARTPAEAGAALEVSVPRYYQLETRALRGLLAACEPMPKGRAPNLARELAQVQRDKERLQREVLRQQTLVRAAQRTVGLAAPPPLKKTSKKTRVRRVARALQVAARLQSAAQDNAPVEGVTSAG